MNFAMDRSGLIHTARLLHAKRVHVQITDDAGCPYSGRARRQSQGDARGNACVDVLVRIGGIGDLGKVCMDSAQV